MDNSARKTLQIRFRKSSVLAHLDDEDRICLQFLPHFVEVIQVEIWVRNFVTSRFKIGQREKKSNQPVPYCRYSLVSFFIGKYIYLPIAGNFLCSEMGSPKLRKTAICLFYHVLLTRSNETAWNSYHLISLRIYARSVTLLIHIGTYTAFCGCSNLRSENQLSKDKSAYEDTKTDCRTCVDGVKPRISELFSNWTRNLVIFLSLERLVEEPEQHFRPNMCRQPRFSTSTSIRHPAFFPPHASIPASTSACTRELITSVVRKIREFKKFPTIRCDPHGGKKQDTHFGQVIWATYMEFWAVIKIRSQLMSAATTSVILGAPNRFHRTNNHY